MPLAGEMKLGDGEGGDGTGAEVALRLLPQPQFRQVVRVDVRLEGGVALQLPFHPPQQTAVSLPPQVLLQLILTRAVRLTQLTIVASGGN